LDEVHQLAAKLKATIGRASTAFWWCHRPTGHVNRFERKRQEL